MGSHSFVGRIDRELCGGLPLAGPVAALAWTVEGGVQ